MPAGLPLPLASAARRLVPPDDATDADLLARFVRSRDETAFEAIVRRHGPAVRGVCRARLGNPADADDAFQATFLVLARDAARVRNRESLAGWLCRVAVLVALKHRRDYARRVTEPLAADPPARDGEPDDAAAARDLRAAVAEELAALPDKFRGVLVLCGLEGRSNTEAAAALGCPKGTVDTRLAAAKRKLRDRLARRGIAFAAAASFEAVLSRADAGPGFESLVSATTAEAVGFSHAAGAGLTHSPAAALANGVKPAMSATTRLLAAAVIAAGALGTAGVGLYRADAQDQTKSPPIPPAATKSETPKKAAEPLPAPDAPADKPAVRPAGSEKETRLGLQRDAGEVPEKLPLREFFDWLYARHGLTARLDLAAFKRLGNGGVDAAAASLLGREVFASTTAAEVIPPDPEVQSFLSLYDTEIRFPVSRGLSVADVLTDAVSQLPGKCTYRVRGAQILVGPAFILPVTPGGGAGRTNDEVNPFVEPKKIAEYIAGPPLSVAVENETLVQAVRTLRQLTGANIVIDSRCSSGANMQLTATFDDVRLLTVLQILGDMCELKPVAMNNVYYLTSPENAAKLQREVNRDLYGERPPPIVAPAPSPQVLPQAQPQPPAATVPKPPEKM